MPWDVAVDSGNNVFVTDYGNNRIQVFSTNGTFLRDWGTEGKGAGEFNHPAVIAFDNAENLYVTDSDNQRIQIFSKNGTYITGFGQMGEGLGGIFETREYNH
jgi:tripartite motif-containing protein 71